MNQTRAFLLFAWFAVATLLWMEWGKEKAAPLASASTTATATTSTVPNASAATSGPAGIPAVPNAPASMTATPPAAAGAIAPVTVTTDVLKVVLDGGELRQADLLRYPSTADADSPPVRL